MNLLDLARTALAVRSLVASDATDSAHYRWRVTPPDGSPFEVCCLPETTVAEMQLLYMRARLESLADAP